MRALDALGTTGDTFAAEILPRIFHGLAPDVENDLARNLLPGLSPGARAEVEALLAARPAPADVLRDALIACLEAPEAHADPQLLVAAFDASLRRAQSRDPGPQAPLDPRVAAIHAVRRLFTQPMPLTPADRVALFRAFPPVAQASAEAAFDAFVTFVAEGTRRGEDPPTLTRRIQLMKLGGEVTTERIQRAFETNA